MSEYSAFAKQIAPSVVVLAQQGNHKALESIYVQYAPACYLLAKRILANEEAAKDVVHNVFIKVIGNIQNLDSSASFNGWLRKIAVNESLQTLKNNDKNRDEDDMQILNEQSAMQPSFFDSKWWETCKDLSSLSQALTPQARTVLFLHQIEGYSHKEIAALFGKSESFSKQSLARSLRTMQLLANKREK